MIIILAVIAGVGLLAAGAAALYRALKHRNYKESQYHKVTGNTRKDLLNDVSKQSEYLIYSALRSYEETGAKFLFNTYIPKANGGTTEIDVLMITNRGIFVFESKSRYGWIEGSDTEKEWSQFLFRKDGTLIRNKIYNPVRQNHGHIAHLKKLIGGSVKMWSVIVFSDKTDIGRIKVSYPDTYVTKECDLAKVVGNIFWNAKRNITERDIMSIYFKLYQYAKVSESEKEQHIEDIKHKYLSGKKLKGKKKLK